ncbi:DUF2950 domain-containing protein [Amaricoccus sp.]|uniref:DUF2950 domain-containing protein n=1 Tax=Amaricoccus sp. TaxID=1872485 RepID=UPI001B62D07B|nr:DUF2950 domain-containing protein [Amaricoccus sp.]MBP7241214.1 DUF2950 domain-containing protein [Amaricoccus sp.]
MTAFRLALGLAALAMAPAALAAPQTFPTPEAAAEAVIAALEAKDRDALVAVFGPENEDVILSGDDVADRAAWAEFLADWRAMHRIETAGDKATLYVGRDQWPFPGPIVEGDAGWSFDAAAAREEVLMRRIGQNELDVIEVMRLYVAAQRAYRAADPDGDGAPSFAASLISDPGTRDGLYWPPEPGVPESPVGDFMARAAADGYSVDGQDQDPEPFHGYYFRILTRQGAAAPGGVADYMIGGRLLGGHALLAFPSAWGDTGVMSFMVGEAGVVYEADLGEDTLAVASAIASFDPGPDWSPVSDD